MKSTNLLGLFVVLLMLCACKKENNVQQPTVKPLTDSASYTINGKKYVSNQIEKDMTYTTQSNTKITSGPNFNYLIQGDKDSLLFVRNFTMWIDNKSFIAVSFIKVYNKEEGTVFASENNGGWLNYPKDRTAIFSPGNYKYATDFLRNNSMSGIAIRLVNNNGTFKSYTQSDLGKPASVTQTDQKDSKFEIISIQKRESDYLLEAKFNVTVFDDNKSVQKIENGYLRFSVLKIQ